MSLEVYNFTWYDGMQYIQIEVLYFPLKFGIISHFEIRSLKPEKAPLPITKTGYLSHHFYPDSIDFSDIGVVQFITDWLNREAEKPDWKDYIQINRQFRLF